MAHRPQLLALPAQVLRHVFVHIVEHGRGAGHAAIEQRAMGLGLLCAAMTSASSSFCAWHGALRSIRQ